MRSIELPRWIFGDLRRRYLLWQSRNAPPPCAQIEATAEFLEAGRSRYILFLVPGRDFVNGGIMSIFSIAAETRALSSVHGAAVAICTGPGELRLLKYTKFDNEFELLAFDDVIGRFPPGSEVLLHLPEVFADRYGAKAINFYRSRPDVRWRLNILLQNIDLIPSRETVKALSTIGPVTATTALATYATPATARRLGCPVKFLSTWVCPEAFQRASYDQKESVVVISPDRHRSKRAILRQITNALPNHRIIEIWNMTFRTYRNVIFSTPYTFTFGEGLDGYFVETVFSGGIGMAIYNERFFTSEYKNLPGVFANEKEAIARVGTFIKESYPRNRYEAIAAAQFSLVSTNHRRDTYLTNLRSYYEDYFRSPARQTASPL